MEQVLYDINDAEVAKMRASSKQFGDSCVSTPILHLIVDDHQVAFVDVEKGVVF